MSVGPFIMFTFLVLENLQCVIVSNVYNDNKEDDNENGKARYIVVVEVP